MDINYKIKDNGKPSVSFKNAGMSGTLSPMSSKQFNYSAVNLFISEFRVNPEINKRKFMIVMRMDGSHKNKGEYRMAQMGFDESELLELRNNIDKMLNDISIGK